MYFKQLEDSCPVCGEEHPLFCCPCGAGPKLQQKKIQCPQCHLQLMRTEKETDNTITKRWNGVQTELWKLWHEGMELAINMMIEAGITNLSREDIGAKLMAHIREVEGEKE